MIPSPARLIPQLATALLVGCPRSGAPPAQPAATREYRPGIDVLDYDLTIELPDSGRVINGRAELTVRRTAAASGSADSDTLTLDLMRLRVSSVSVNGTSVGFGRTA